MGSNRESPLMSRGPSQRLTRSQSLAYGLMGTLLFLGIWSGLSFSDFVPHQFLPSPYDVGSRFVQLLSVPFAGATLPQHLASSVLRFSYGFFLGAAIGIPLGLLMGWFRILDEIISPIFDGLRFIAPIAWVPFAALWFGTGIDGPILIIFAGAFPPCLINSYRGARFVSRPLIEAAQMLGTGHARIILEVLLPASTASIIAGLRVSAGLGWQSLIGAELIVASTGIGFMMSQAQLDLATPTVMSAMVAIGLIGLLFDVALRWIETTVRQRGLA